MINYRTDMGQVQGKINYRLMDGATTLEDHPDAWCYASLFNGKVPDNCKTIEIYHPPAEIPYTKESIERWVKVLNDIGFPCSFEFGEMVIFKVEIAAYKYKLHLLSTLMLIRNLIEDCLTPLPEFFFQHEDEHPKCDRFKVMIEMHERKYAYARDIHMVTYRNKGHDRIVGSFEELMAQFEASKMDIHYSGRGPKGGLAVNSAWWGDYAPKPAAPVAVVEPPKPVVEEVFVDYAEPVQVKPKKRNIKKRNIKKKELV